MPYTRSGASPAQPGTSPTPGSPALGSVRGAPSSPLGEIPRSAFAIRLADRSTYRSTWSELAARNCSRVGAARPATAAPRALEARPAFRQLPTDEFFAMFDARFPKAGADEDQSELAGSLRQLRASVAEQEEERLHLLTAAGAAPPRSDAGGDPLLGGNAERGWGRLPAAHEEMMLAVQPGDAPELLAAQQYELAAAAFLRGMAEQPRLHEQHAAGFRHALQQLRWRDPRYAGRLGQRLVRCTVHTSHKAYEVVEDVQSGQLVWPSAPNELLAAAMGRRASSASAAAEAGAGEGGAAPERPRARRSTKPQYDDGSDARAFGAAIDRALVESRELLPPGDEAAAAAVRARLAARAAQLSHAFRHFAAPERPGEARALSRAGFAAFCAEARLAAPRGGDGDGGGRGTDVEGADGGADGDGGDAAEPAEPAAPVDLHVLPASEIDAAFSSASGAALLVDRKAPPRGPAAAQPAGPEAPEPPPPAGPEAGAEPALAFPSFVAALLRLARVLCGANESLAASFERCWDGHFSNAVGAASCAPDSRLRQLLDTEPMAALYARHEEALRAVFRFHAQEIAEIPADSDRHSRARAGAPAPGTEAAAVGIRERVAVRKWIANHGPTIGYAEWQLFWAVCSKAVAAESRRSGLGGVAPRRSSLGGGGPDGGGGRAEARRGEGRAGLLPAAVLQRAFLAAQSEELEASVSLPRAAAAGAPAFVAAPAAGPAPDAEHRPLADLRMTWKEFWEGLARAAVAAPAPLLLRLCELNRAALAGLSIGSLDLPAPAPSAVGVVGGARGPRGGDGRAAQPAERLLGPIGVELRADALHARSEVLLQTALRSCAGVWGAYAAAPAEPPGGGAAAGKGSPAGRARAAFAQQQSLGSAAGRREGASPRPREARQAAVRKVRQALLEEVGLPADFA